MSIIMNRYAVEWYVPDTMIGDGRPSNGVTYVYAKDANAAWDRFEGLHTGPDRYHYGKLGRHPNSQAVRVGHPEDLIKLRPLRALIDQQGLR